MSAIIIEVNESNLNLTAACDVVTRAGRNVSYKNHILISLPQPDYEWVPDLRIPTCDVRKLDNIQQRHCPMLA